MKSRHEYKYDIGISYARADEALVRVVVSKLRKEHGLRVFIDWEHESKFKGSVEYVRRQISKEFETECVLIVAFFNTDWIHSKWCQDEYLAACRSVQERNENCFLPVKIRHIDERQKYELQDHFLVVDVASEKSENQGTAIVNFIKAFFDHHFPLEAPVEVTESPAVTFLPRNQQEARGSAVPPPKEPKPSAQLPDQKKDTDNRGPTVHNSSSDWKSWIAFACSLIFLLGVFSLPEPEPEAEFIKLFFIDLAPGKAPKPPGKIIQAVSVSLKKISKLENFRIPTIDLDMVWVNPGTFMMGSPTSEKGRDDDDETQHQVTLTKGFWLGKYEVTQGQWKALMDGENPSRFREFEDSDRHPVERISWGDCQEFIKRLNNNQEYTRFLPEGYEYRLPTEAEWEYACRAGTESSYNDGSQCTEPFGHDPALDQMGWFDRNSDSKTHPVGKKKPNAWGLYDMHGNVWEWCHDWYGLYSSGSVSDSSEPDQGVVRGGGWGHYAGLCRSAYRLRSEPDYCDLTQGFRLAAGPVNQDFRIPELDLDMVWVNPGDFTMGSPETEEDRSTDETQHEVKLTKGFWLGKYEVTQGQWKALMDSENPSYFKEFEDSDRHPVETVSWDDCQKFIERLNSNQEYLKLLPEGYEYRLPTEAEWEYACRARTELSYNGPNGEPLSQLGYYNENSGSKTHPIGGMKANSWGFHDMHGNVWEWCHDRYGEYSSGPVSDPSGPDQGGLRVLRGGCWFNDAWLCRSALRFGYEPDDRYYARGFRLAAGPVIPD